MIEWVILGLGAVGFVAALRWIGKSSTKGVYDDESESRTRYIRLRHPGDH